MDDFFKKFKIKGEQDPIQSLEEFQNLRVGVEIEKNSGETFTKVDEDVFDKVEQNFLNKTEIEKDYAKLNQANVFSQPQEISSNEFSKDSQIVTKGYVDTQIDLAKINTSNFAKTDESNIFSEIQSCAETPTKRQHLTNKAYVDDAINDLSFDTSQLAKLNQANVFSEIQSCSVIPTESSHLTNKSYVDGTVANINADLSHFIRDDTENEFTETQTFDNQIISKATPTSDFNVVNLKFLNSQINNIKTGFSDFASKTKENEFNGVNTFNNEVIINTKPVLNSHAATKSYVDGLIKDLNIDTKNVVYKNKSNTFSADQNFEANVSVIEPTDIHHATSKQYVDNKITELSENTSNLISYATEEVPGKVQLSPDIAASKENSVAVPTDYNIKQFVLDSIGDIDNTGMVTLEGQQTIRSTKTFQQGLIVNSISDGNSIRYFLSGVNLNESEIEFNDDFVTQQITFEDEDYNNLSSIIFDYDSDQNIISFGLTLSYPGTDSEGNQNFDGVYLDYDQNSKTIYATCPNPDSNASNNEIATASWVNSKINSSKTELQNTINNLSNSVSANSKTISDNKTETDKKINDLTTNLASSYVTLGTDQTISGVKTFKTSPQVPDPVNDSDVVNINYVKNLILNAVYPVGSIYMSVNNVSPQTFIGGTWLALENRFLIGASSSYPVNSTGGATTHTLTVAEMPSHSHSFAGSSIAAHYHDYREISALESSSTFSGSAKLFPGSTTTTRGDGSEGNSYIHTFKTNLNSALSTSGSISSTGSGNAHSIMNPYLAVYMWKRTA